MVMLVYQRVIQVSKLWELMHGTFGQDHGFLSWRSQKGVTIWRLVPTHPVSADTHIASKTVNSSSADGSSSSFISAAVFPLRLFKIGPNEIHILFVLTSEAEVHRYPEHRILLHFQPLWQLETINMSSYSSIVQPIPYVPCRQYLTYIYIWTVYYYVFKYFPTVTPR